MKKSRLKNIIKEELRKLRTSNINLLNEDFIDIKCRCNDVPEHCTGSLTGSTVNCSCCALYNGGLVHVPIGGFKHI